MPYMYAFMYDLDVCLICMPYMYAFMYALYVCCDLDVCLVCVPCMSALYVCLICLLCGRECDCRDGKAVEVRRMCSVDTYNN